MNESLEGEQGDTKRGLPRAESDGAERGAAGAEPGDESPAAYLQNRAAQRQRGPGLARPHARPCKRQEDRGNSRGFDQRPFATRDDTDGPGVES